MWVAGDMPVWDSIWCSASLPVCQPACRASSQMTVRPAAQGRLRAEPTLSSAPGGVTNPRWAARRRELPRCLESKTCREMSERCRACARCIHGTVSATPRVRALRGRPPLGDTPRARVERPAKRNFAGQRRTCQRLSGACSAKLSALGQ